MINKCNLKSIGLSAIAALVLVAFTGCGGGSAATGIKPFGDQSIPERPLDIHWPKFALNSCTVRRGSQEIELRVKTEVGFAAPLEDAARVCGFVISKQAEQIEILSSAFSTLSAVPYRTEQVSCQSRTSIPLMTGTLQVHESGVKVPRSALRWDRSSFVTVTLTPPGSAAIAVELHNDANTICKEN